MASVPVDAAYNRALLNVLPVAVVVAHPDTGEVADANDAFLALVGRSREEVVGVRQPYPWRTDTEEGPAAPGTVIERDYLNAGGRAIPVQIATRVLQASDGSPALVVGIVTDLSEKRRLERQLVQSGKLAAIGELAAGVAHEINNPLLAILGLTEFLLADAEPGSKQRERLELVQATGHEIKVIVRALLEFARERPDERRAVELDGIVSKTITLVRRTNAHKGIEIVERYGAPGALVSASGDQLEQLVLNLMANARQAMPVGGAVTVETTRVNGHVHLVVTDEGPGIPAELQTRIFEPFFTTRRSTGGTGLGLSVSLGIAEAHGGTLTVASEHGHGAAFTLRLPVDQEAS